MIGTISMVCLLFFFVIPLVLAIVATDDFPTCNSLEIVLQLFPCSKRLIILFCVSLDNFFISCCEARVLSQIKEAYNKCQCIFVSLCNTFPVNIAWEALIVFFGLCEKFHAVRESVQMMCIKTAIFLSYSTSKIFPFFAKIF